MKKELIDVFIQTERIRQDLIHPQFLENEALAVLMEEVGELATSIQNNDSDNKVEELVQIAAYCIRWLTNIKVQA